MLRLIPALLLFALSTSSQVCEYDLQVKWNRFVDDANTYAQGLKMGVKNIKLRDSVEREWKAVTRSECW